MTMPDSVMAVPRPARFTSHRTAVVNSDVVHIEYDRGAGEAKLHIGRHFSVGISERFDLDYSNTVDGLPTVLKAQFALTDAISRTRSNDVTRKEGYREMVTMFDVMRNDISFYQNYYAAMNVALARLEAHPFAFPITDVEESSGDYIRLSFKDAISYCFLIDPTSIEVRFSGVDWAYQAWSTLADVNSFGEYVHTHVHLMDRIRRMDLPTDLTWTDEGGAVNPLTCKLYGAEDQKYYQTVFSAFMGAPMTAVASSLALILQDERKWNAGTLYNRELCRITEADQILNFIVTNRSFFGFDTCFVVGPKQAITQGNRSNGAGGRAAQTLFKVSNVAELGDVPDYVTRNFPNQAGGAVIAPKSVLEHTLALNRYAILTAGVGHVRLIRLKRQEEYSVSHIPPSEMMKSLDRNEVMTVGVKVEHVDADPKEDIFAIFDPQPLTLGRFNFITLVNWDDMLNSASQIMRNAQNNADADVTVGSLSCADIGGDSTLAVIADLELPITAKVATPPSIVFQ
jgi:hypothetical protein